MFERNYAKRRLIGHPSSANAGEERLKRRPTLTELSRTKYADEIDPHRYVEEEIVRVEAMKLRNKLAQNRVPLYSRHVLTGFADLSSG